ncbi:DEAD/DEAH box RNA helicase [Thermococcus kodakarensis KOD1]|uniref:RNA helicase n=1 Tax=Thermococcus kodakarensis (strain ATCC BAA-918 / JCM 12380 / KOD1) TaxID=69014 RepID=Q5JFZ6_THEKO|nr:DEAD/DEAH box helicase [Thermococcus kodakarensis]WCN28383.1 DEAD/DEAH box helicase [Thermococcus kodakarensis]WCN30679.1 DEAD/DEAH box helicase [Thermococcus kodakarensis]BAD84495.1 DEAD/DEAH box RNA helicase [Thermococcus kodakarensis KOD1]
MSFRELGLSSASVEAVERKGFSIPTDIQREVIPLLLSAESDIVGQSKTGSGKTAAFGLPILDSIDESIREVQALILTPTRELAIQVTDELRSLRGKRRIYVYSVYGGQPIGPQIRALEGGVHIVVGTPGRVLDHINRGTLNLDGVRFFVLDEADRMLDMGFQEDIEAIFRATPKEKRVLMFSATMPMDVLLLAKKYMRNPEVVIVSRDELVPGEVEQEYIEAVPHRRFDLLTKILSDESNEFYGIVFCQTKAETRELSMRLRAAGFRAEALNGDMSQPAREKTFNRFKARKTKILVATDVAARGLDVPEITHVINYSIPMNPEQYIHRIGRTGRMGKKGKAITFIAPGELRRFRYITKQAGVEVKKSELSEGIPKEYRERLRQEELEGEYRGRWGSMKPRQRRRRY